MRIKGSLTKGLLVALSLTLIPIMAFSAQKITPGSTCKVLNQKVVYQNKTYTCIKSGKKLVWNKGVKYAKVISTPTASPSPAPSPTKTPIPTSSPTPTPKFNLLIDCGGNFVSCPEETNSNVTNTNYCKVQVPDNQLVSGGSIGFPRPKYATSIRSPKILLVPVSFSNLKFGNIKEELQKRIDFSKQFYAQNSWGKINLDFQVVPTENELYLPVKFEEFRDSHNSNLTLATQELVSMTKYPKLSNYESIIFITPQSSSITWGGGNVGANYPSSYGEVGNVYLSVGGINPVEFPHLLGHTLYALSDLYISSQAINERIQIPENLLFYDVMQNGYSKDFVGFIRWVNGWLDESQMVCLENRSQNAVVHINFIDDPAGSKLIGIPVKEGKVLFAEYRAGSWDDGKGLLVYSFDQTVPPGHGQMRQVRLNDMVETLLVNGQSGILDGVNFKVLAVDAKGIFVQVSIP